MTPADKLKYNCKRLWVTFPRKGTPPPNRETARIVPL
jgi:hypothetical protein